MAINYNVAVKTARMAATRDYFASGTLEIQNSGGTALVTFDLSATGGTVSGDTWTLALEAATVAADNDGTASQAVIKTSGGLAHLTGLTVGTSGSDITIDNTSINSGQNVTLSSATIQHA